MAHNKLICLITPYALTSRTTEEELESNVLYSQLLTSVANLVPGVEIYSPTLQNSSLPDFFVNHPKIKSDLLYKHCKENVDNPVYGWRSCTSLQQKADEIWFGADCGLVPPIGVKTRNVSIKNLHLITDHPGYIQFINTLSSSVNYRENTIDLVKTVIKLNSGQEEIILLQKND